MSDYESISRRRFSRNRDRALVAGVCAGLADHFGFNLKVTRILAVISLLSAMPLTLLAYFGAVFLFPSLPDSSRRAGRDAARAKTGSEDPRKWLTSVQRL